MGTSSYTQSIAGCLDGAIGKHGLSDGRARALARSARAALSPRCRTTTQARRLPHLRIAEETADLAAAEAALARLSQGADTIVFFGIGGSSLGGQTLAQLGGWHIPGMATPEQRRRPRTRFYDNLDPVTLEAALASFDLADTRFVVISKSGGTPETLVQALAALGAVKAAGLEQRAPELFLGITEPAVAGKANGLRTLFEAHGIPILDHHPGIGGRYSVFTNVGLLPAMARGLDPRAVRAGARDVVDALMAAKSPRGFAPAEGAAIAVGLARERGIKVAGDDALLGPARAPRRLVRAAVGGEPRQERPGHGAHRLPRPRRPAQPAAAVHGRPARAPDQHRARPVCRARAPHLAGARRQRPASTTSPAARRATSSPPRPRPCPRRCRRPAGPCAPSISPGLTSGASGR